MNSIFINLTGDKDRLGWFRIFDGFEFQPDLTSHFGVTCAWAVKKMMSLLHIKVHLPVLLCAVKTVEGDFRFCWTTTPNVGQTHKENPNLVRILYMVCTLNDIYKQYNKLHEHWYTKISSLRCVADRNPPQNASDLYTRYWSDAEHCRPCTRLSGVNWWKQKQITLIVPIGYSLFADHRSVPSSGPWLVCLTILCLSRVRVHRFRDNAVTGDIPLISPVLESMVPP